MSAPIGSVGCRVVDSEGYRATVRYVGPVIGAKNPDEIWFGVEWDVPTRGKHNGSSVDSKTGTLHRYFDCAPGSGSFIKPSKVEYGRTFVEALHDRYVSLDAPSVAEPDAKLPNAFVSTSKGNQKSIEFVGEEKIRKRQQIANVTTVTVRSDTVCTMGAGIGDIASHLLEIDLQDNLISSWAEIGKLGSEVPNLGVLLLHSNKMLPFTEVLSAGMPGGCFSNLRVLALNSCGITSWASVQLLEPHLPIIEELFLAGNALTDLPRLKAEQNYQDATGAMPSTLLKVSGFPTLRLLDISCCGLDEWSQVMVFKQLPALQELLLDSNPLCDVTGPGDGDFVKLQRFSLSNTGLSSWKDVNTLALYPGLRILRLSQIPLFVGRGSSEVRPEVIARVKQLVFFNGSQITPRERGEAEKNYCRLVLYDAVTRCEEKERFEMHEHNVLSPPSEPPAAASALVATVFAGAASGVVNSGFTPAVAAMVDVELHPRFAELMTVFGADLAPPSRSTAGPANLAAELVSVTLRNLSFSSNGSLEPMSKRLPRSLLVSKLQLLVKQLFGLDPRLQQLSMRVHRDAPPTLLDDEKSSLQYYGVTDGAEIFINEAKG